MLMIKEQREVLVNRISMCNYRDRVLRQLVNIWKLSEIFVIFREMFEVRGGNGMATASVNDVILGFASVRLVALMIG